MSRGDGIGIRVNFSERLIAISATDASRFSVNFNTYDYVPDGNLVEVSKTPVSISHPNLIKDVVDLSDGTLSGTQIADGVLCLAEQQ